MKGMFGMNTAERINILGGFCGKRDIPDLTQHSLKNKYGIEKADVFVLFGGSILEGGNVLAQDATMQHRMAATLKKYVADEMLIINYATYQVSVCQKGDELTYREQPLGMWDIDRYITLLMGEIPRLSDDENGYGPRGKNYISHVDIPQDVKDAFGELKEIYSGSVREANPLYASN